MSSLKPKSLSFGNTRKDSNLNKSYKTTTSIKSITNISSFKKFMIKNDNTGLNITIVPQRTHLYQGVSFEFDLSIPSSKKIQEFYNYYNERHNGAYFLSSQKIASKYGLDMDYSNIVYTTIPGPDEVEHPTNKYEHIYPLYYIPGRRGSNIKYKLTKDLYLIDIGDIQNIQFIWHLIQDLGIDDKTQDEYYDLLFQTCAEYDDNIHQSSPRHLPIKCARTSYDFTDKLLVLFFQDVLVPVLKSKYKINIDGWIYYNTQHFHEEILLVNNTYLDFQNVTKMKATTYDDIPTVTQFKKSMQYKRKLYNESIRKNVILSNFVQIDPLSK
jgi:hypothetical protein